MKKFSLIFMIYILFIGCASRKPNNLGKIEVIKSKLVYII